MASVDSVAAKITFSADEKDLLVSLVKREKVIEDKRTNRVTNKLKADAWERIQKKYNSHDFVSKREIIQLKRCWEKLKRAIKEAQSQEIKCGLSSSNGSPPPSEDYVPGEYEVVPHTVDCDPALSATTMATDLITTRQSNILQGREEQKQLFLIRRSILMIEKEIAAEKLRSLIEINRTKELMEVEKLEHQRELHKIELQHALGPPQKLGSDSQLQKS
ncbi:uncharacterized protein LOC123879524 [Maniola jurtina]|uniref:uncharacterized protein LOC123879524 n=1 Tax=Maniola jurtina TaxID=191418 RepID=UPI001E68D850|nr:uncharacterized protein LOC123879524 [Maniola jurtina]